MVGSKRRHAFAAIVVTVAAGFLVSSCATLGLTASPLVQGPGKLTFALSDGATGGGPVSVYLQRSSDSFGVDYIGALTTGSGFDGPQGQFQVRLHGVVVNPCDLGFCDQGPGIPFYRLDSFRLTSPSGLEVTGDAVLGAAFNDPSLCPTHILDAVHGSKVELHGSVVGDPSLTAELEVWTCLPLQF